MSFRSLGISIFILLFFFTWELAPIINASIPDNNNRVFGVHYAPRSPGDTINTTSVIAGVQTLDLLDAPANEHENEGGSFRDMKVSKVITNILINSTTGFAQFIKTLLNITNNASATAWLIDLLQWGLILNHAWALFQLITGRTFGGAT